MTVKQWNERSQMSFLHHDAENRLLSLFRKLSRWKEERVSRDGTTRRQDQIKELNSRGSNEG